MSVVFLAAAVLFSQCCNTVFLVHSGLELLPPSTGSGSQVCHAFLSEYSLRVSFIKVKLEACTSDASSSLLHRYSLRISILNIFLVLFSYPESLFPDVSTNWKVLTKLVGVQLSKKY